MNSKFKIIKIVIGCILILASFFILRYFLSSKFEGYYKECEKCIDSQEKINDAISKYNKNEKEHNLKNIINSDSQLSLKTLHEKGYLKELVTGAEKECDFRYDINNSRLYCVKHGNLEFVKEYRYYKNKDDNDTFIWMLFNMIVVILAIYAIIS